MNIHKLLATAGIVVAIALSFFALHTSSHTSSDFKAGSVASPDSPFSWWSFTGIREDGGRSDSLIQATTTVCAIQAPAATSTLVTATIFESVSTTTAFTMTIARSATAFATTTALARMAFAANTTPFLVATNTVAVLTDGIIAPNSYIVFSMEGGTGNFSPTGSCKAIFREI